MTILRTNTIAGIGSDGAGTVLGGSFSFTSQNYVILPKGTTDNRVGLGSTPGALRYNTDSNKVELYDGSQWTEVQASIPLTGGPRGLIFAGYAQPATPAVNIIDYITISTTGNAVDFGDVLQATLRSNTALGSSTRGVCAGGGGPSANVNVIQYVTISSTGNAIDFGDLSAVSTGTCSFSNSTRGVFNLGLNPPSTWLNTLEFITIASTGNSIDFGDTTQAREQVAQGSCASSTRGLLIGGYNNGTAYNIIDYVTTMSTGNAVDFGDLTGVRRLLGAASNSVRCVVAGGYAGSPASASNIIEYVTISTLGNSIDFGDRTFASTENCGLSSPTRGVFCGSSTPISNVLDYVSIMNLGNAMDFGDLTQARGDSGACSNAHGGL